MTNKEIDNIDKNKQIISETNIEPWQPRNKVNLFYFRNN